MQNFKSVFLETRKIDIGCSGIAPTKLWMKSDAINSVGDPNVPPSVNLKLGSIRSPIVITDPGRFVPLIALYSVVGLFLTRFT
ncbi:MAG: hypothetical protein GY820_20920 [Gammaproteobacteria bacterium]|nr:hypothetical protein [Gammaproteobacteria bacterium]